MERKNNLIAASLKMYLFATIASTIVTTLNSVIDGILMGRLLGTDALAAINVSMPAINSLMIFGAIFINGAKLMMSKLLGQNDYEKANKVYTISNLAIIFIGVLIAIFSVPLSSIVSNVLSVDKDLTPLVREYIYIHFLCNLAIMLHGNISSIVIVKGNPDVATRGTLFIVIANIACDILYVAVFKMGIAGSAFASITGYALALVYLLIYLLRSKGELKLTFKLNNGFKILIEIMLKGFLGVLMMSMNVLLTLVCNYFVQKYTGKEGMFVMSIGYAMIGIGTMVASSAGLSYTAIGGMLLGQKDYAGLKMLYKKVLLISVCSAAFFLIVSSIFPYQIARLYGTTDPKFTGYVAGKIPLISMYVLAISVVMPLTYLYQIIEKYLNAYIILISLFVSAMVGIAASTILVAPRALWFAFPIATIFTLIVGFIATEISVIKSKGKLSHISLIPKDVNVDTLFNVSIECIKEKTNDAIIEIAKRVKDAGLGNVGQKIRLCLEELIVNYLTYSGRGKGDYIDTIVSYDGENIIAIFRDNGHPFDLVHCVEDKKSMEVKVAESFCDEMKYSYSFGQNVTFLKWKNEQKR